MGIGIALIVVACIITVATILYTGVYAKIEAIDVEQLAEKMQGIICLT